MTTALDLSLFNLSIYWRNYLDKTLITHKNTRYMKKTHEEPHSISKYTAQDVK